LAASRIEPRNSGACSRLTSKQRLGSARAASEPLERKHRDKPPRCKAVLEDVLFKMLKRPLCADQEEGLVPGGWVAFNCVATVRSLSERRLKRFMYNRGGRCRFGSGGSLLRSSSASRPTACFCHGSCVLGTGFYPEEIQQVLNRHRARDGRLEVSKFATRRIGEDHCQAHCRRESCGLVSRTYGVGSPALGNRSILVDRGGQR